MIAYFGEYVELGEHSWEYVELGEHSYIAGGSSKLYNHIGNQYGGSSENWESIYLKTKQYHSWAHIQSMRVHTTKTFAQLCS